MQNLHCDAFWARAEQGSVVSVGSFEHAHAKRDAALHLKKSRHRCGGGRLAASKDGQRECRAIANALVLWEKIEAMG